MIYKKTNRFSTKARRSVRAISPVIATLLMIAIAVAASLVAYAWVMGYIGTTTDSAGRSVMIQSVAKDSAGEITVYVQNTGEADTRIRNIYVNDVQILDYNDVIHPGDTVGIRLPPVPLADPSKVTVKVYTDQGTFFEYKKTFTGASGSGGANPTPTPTSTATTQFVYQKAITFSTTGVQGTHSNFPVLIKLTDDVQIAAKSDDGTEIYFTSDVAGNSKLAHELVSYFEDANGADVEAWVRVPSLSAGTTIYIWYGATSPAEQDSTGVWDDNYRGVWHLDENGNNVANNYKDATGYANHGTGTSMTAASKVAGIAGSGQYFDGNGDFITITGSDSLNYPAPLTVEAWVKYENPTGWFMGKCTNDNDVNWKMRGFGINCYGQTRLWFNTASGDGAYVSNAIPTVNTWVHVAATIVGNNLKLYINGALNGDYTINTAGALVGGTSPLYLGRGIPIDTPTFKGTLDEVRVSNMARSENWLKTEFNNMNNPSGFISVGSEQPITA